MWTLKPSDGSKDTYGLGWGVPDEDGLKVAGHSGGQQGTSTDFLIAPDKRAVWWCSQMWKRLIRMNWQSRF
jgi:hypothetical protein